MSSNMRLLSIAAASAMANVIVINATDYAFNAPSEIPAGLTNFRMVDNRDG